MALRFPQLGVLVDGAYVYAGAWLGSANKTPLGTLEGAQASLGEPTRHRRVGAATLTTAATAPLLGPPGVVVGLSKKSKSIAFVVTGDGHVHERKLDGNMAIRQAQGEVVRFNAMAARAAPPAPAPPDPAVQEQIDELRATVDKLQAQLGDQAQPGTDTGD
jgi:hypothetical protein